MLFETCAIAGNLLARPDGRLCYLDFGMMSYASKAQRNGFLLAVVHIVNRDWSALVRLYQRLGFIPEGEFFRVNSILALPPASVRCALHCVLSESVDLLLL